MALHSLLNQIKLINNTDNTDAFKACISNSYTWLETEFQHAEITSLVTGRAAFVDTLLTHIWKLIGLADTPVSLVAVGGYGRGQLQPYSDVDLLILSKKALDDQQQQMVSDFVTLLWDIGLDLGQSVRTLDQTLKLAKQDVTIATNLLEARLLHGDKALYTKLRKRLYSNRIFTSKDFFLAKYKEQQERHAKFNDTSYNLEPNVKENPGCLRDIQSIGWVAKKHFEVLKGTELVEAGYFTTDELDELIECRTSLWRIRFALHLEAGRSENRLLFDYQPDVARRLGYGDEGKASVEKMMKDFFRVVRRITELNEMLLQHFRQDILNLKVKQRTAVNGDFEIRDSLIYPLNNQVFSSPEAILQFFHIIADNPDIKGLHSVTLRYLRNARRHFRSQYWSELPECRSQFMALVKKPAFFGLGWDLMHKHGILQSYLQQWDHIVGMMQFDLFHAYTVDEHTHRLIKNIEEYGDKTRNSRFPRCGRIMNNLDKPELLFLAGIFHDIGKGRNGDHSVLGADDVKVFCASHQIPESDANLIEWLVRHHLLMSVVAQRRDIYDPEVIQEFATTVRSQNNLNHLYALTLADIRATNDNLWNDWKSSLLRELYLITQKTLASGLECKIDLQARMQEHKTTAMQLLQEQGIPQQRVERLWKYLPEDYFIRFKPAQVAWHSHAIIQGLDKLSDEQREKDVLLVDVSDDTTKAGTELMLFGHDRPSLFAQVASVLDSRNCSIQDANIIVTREGYIFDSFIILEQNGNRITSPSRINSLKKAITTQLQKPGVEHTNPRRMPRQFKKLDVPTKVRFFGGQSDITMLELEALDAPGLLAKLGHLFVSLKLSLKMAKITTIGERAEDLFIICNDQGKALTTEQQVLLKKRLAEALD